MRKLIEYFIDYPIASNLLMVAIFIFGTYGMMNMSSSFFPKSESRNIVVQISYPGASPEEIEKGIVTKIEEGVKSVTGLERVTSTSSENTGIVNIEITKGQNLDAILSDVKNAVDRINSFPAAMEPLSIFKKEKIEEVISFSLSGDVDLKTLKYFGKKVEDQLLAIDGISKVGLQGFPNEEIEISFRETDLQRYQLTFAQAAKAIQASNLEMTGGTIEGQDQELLIRAKNKKYYADELRETVVINTPNQGVVKLYQIADIKDQWEDNPNRSFINGEPAVVVKVKNIPEEDALKIAKDVRNFIDDFNTKNEIVQAKIIKDESVILMNRINLLTENGIAGFVIVILLLGMFLHWRMAFWVALSIPISFAGMFFCAYYLGATLNMVSIFGMILVIGILVDDGIVISESIYQEAEKGLSPRDAAVEGTMKVLPAVFGAILTTCIAFFGFYFVDGRFGEFFGAISTIVIFCLIFSLVEAAFILPAHLASSKAMNKNVKKNIISQKLESLMDGFRDKIYVPILDFSLNNKFVLIASVTALLLITQGAIEGGIIRSTFFPKIEPNSSVISLKLPAGTSERITTDWLNKIENAVWEVNQELSDDYYDGEKNPVVKTGKNIGPSTAEGDIEITVLNSKELGDNLTISDLNIAFREKIGPIPEAEHFNVGAGRLFGKPVAFALRSENLEELKYAVKEVKDSLFNLEELTDISDNYQEGLQEINIKLKEKGTFLGLKLQDVISQVRAGWFGYEIQRLQRGRDEIRVWARYQSDERTNINQLKNMRIRLPDGRAYPLGEIAKLEVDKGVLSINHIDGKRSIEVTADLFSKEASTKELNETVQGYLLPLVLKKYPTVTFSKEGESRENALSLLSLVRVMPIVLLIMLFVIALTFRSIGQTISVVAIIPFGIIGMGLGHYLLDYQISMASYLGYMALIGIMVNDALVFITTYNQFLEKGKSQLESVREAGITRFRPIVLTSLTTIAGLSPLIFEKNVQAKLVVPMAISVAFGLLIVTVIILLFLPVLLSLMNSIRRYGYYAWEGVKLTPEMVEPAVKGRISNYPVWLVSALLLFAGFAGSLMLMLRLTDGFFG